MLKIGKYFNSVQFVVQCIVLLQVMLMLDTATLLYRAFPADMPSHLKLLSSAFGAVSIEAFMLMISVNMYLLRDRFGNHALPVTSGLFGSIMTMFFLEGFDAEPGAVVICMRVFVSVVFGFMNYLLSEVFVKKWDEHTRDLSQMVEIQSLKTTIADLGRAIVKQDAQIHHLQSQVSHHESLNHHALVTEHEQLVIKHEQLVTEHEQLVTTRDALVTANQQIKELTVALEHSERMRKRPKAKKTETPTS